MPTFIIAECVLIYLDPDSSRAIVGWASKKFATAIFFLYEQIHPYDAFGEQMIKNLEVGKAYIYILMSRLNSPDVSTFLHRVEDVDSWVSMLHRLYRRRKIYFFTRDGRCTSLIRGLKIRLLWLDLLLFAFLSPISFWMHATWIFTL